MERCLLTKPRHPLESFSEVHSLPLACVLLSHPVSFPSILHLRLRLFFFPRTGREDGPESQPYSIQGYILEGDHSHSAQWVTTVGGGVVMQDPGLWGWVRVKLIPDLLIFSGNGTLNKHSGIDFKQLNFLAKLNENHSGEVILALLAPP